MLKEIKTCETGKRQDRNELGGRVKRSRRGNEDVGVAVSYALWLERLLHANPTQSVSSPTGEAAPESLFDRVDFCRLDRFEDIRMAVADLVLMMVSSFGRCAACPALEGVRRVPRFMALCENGMGVSESESSEESYPGGAATGRRRVFRLAKPLSSESSDVSNERLRVRWTERDWLVRLRKRDSMSSVSVGLLFSFFSFSMTSFS